MQRIINLWKSGRTGKLVIAIGSIIAFCCSCLLFGLVLPKSPPTPTPIVTETSLVAATATTAPTLTNTPTPPSTDTSMIPTATPQPTQMPIPTATIIVILPTSPPAQNAVCTCSYDAYNCSKSDFASKGAAQACYDYCKSVGAGDVHGLDRDSDGRACDSGLN